MNGTRELAGAGLGAVLAHPNPENKLFIGGAPPGTDEETLRRIFSVHGEVEEVFVMRGGSRSGQACAFVRFMTAEGAVAAIQAIHGKYVMEGCQDPLVVRYADAPGSRAKSNRGQRGGGFGGYPGGYPGYPGGPGPGMWPGYGMPGGYPPPGFGMPPYGMPGAPPMAMMGGYPNPQAMANVGMANVAAVAAVHQQSIPPSQLAMPGMAGLPLMMGGAPVQPTMQVPAPAQQPVMVSGTPVDGVADWAAYTAPDGRSYFYNAKTGVSTWTKPMPAGGPAQSPSPPAVATGSGLNGHGGVASTEVMIQQSQVPASVSAGATLPTSAPGINFNGAFAF